MRSLLLISLAGLLGCGQVPPGSLAELARFDPLASDLGAITVAVDVSEGLRVREGGALMELRAQTPDGRAVSERFVLTQTRVAGTRWLFGVAASDAPRLEAARQQIRALKADDPDTVGQLSVTAAPCTTGDARADRVDMFLRLAPDRPFVPVASQVDLAAQEVPVPPCGPDQGRGAEDGI